MDKRVLVTGASGFIGANLVRSLLRRGDEVHIFQRPESNQWRLAEIKRELKLHDVYINDRVGVLKTVDAIQPEQVFHLAHYGGNPNESDPTLINRVIIEGTAALFDACAKVGSVRAIVNAGSSSEYGSKFYPMKENMILEPNTPYGCAKAWASLYGQYLSSEKNIPIVTLRLFSVFGPWEASTRFIPTAILSSLWGKPLKISNLNTVRDFIFVDDVVVAFLLAVDNALDHSKPINIGFGSQITLGGMLELIFEYTGRKVPIEISGVGRSFDNSNAMWQADILRAKEVLGWKPNFSRETAIYTTVNWFMENGGRLYQNV